jgi:dTDP-4-amino-4,6-dideoxygalactose transaminase
MNVPFLDLNAQYRALRTEIHAAIQQVLDSSAFAGGPFVAAFEKEFAAFCGTREAVGVGNGTDALWLALLACGIGAGDEVITVPNTFIATTEAIGLCGATPVFVDVDPGTYTLDPARLQAAITPRTRAIIPVHLYGQVADMDPILEVARRHGLVVIEDACQAHGARYKGRMAGAMGIAGCFSFYPGKNLGAYGEAGAVVTHDSALADTIRILREHGQPRKYIHAVPGWNARMDGIQGAILSVKLKHLNAANEARRAHARQYGERLAGEAAITLPVEAPYARHVYHLYVIRVPERDPVIARLGARGITCGIHYPVPLHLQEAYAPLGIAEGSFPVSERSARELVSLPMFPELTREQVDAVAEALLSVVKDLKVTRRSGG